MYLPQIVRVAILNSVFKLHIYQNGHFSLDYNLILSHFMCFLIENVRQLF